MKKVVKILDVEGRWGTELGNTGFLKYCYWNLGRFARERGDTGGADDKLRAALAISTDLKMPREQDAVKKELGEV